VGGGITAYKIHKHNQEAKAQEAQKEYKDEEHSVLNDSSVKKDEEKSKTSASKESIRPKGEGNEEGDESEYDDDDEGGSVVKTPVTTATTPSSTTTVKTYTLADIKLHNTRTSCWTAVNGSVYDVTSWISQHPGGSSAILGMCGIDGSSAFNGQHGGQSRPASELASFKIGTLK
jgi:cytochrome b involved in lipid metabolism